MKDTRPIWQLRVLIQASSEEVAEIEGRIGSAICPDPDHEGFCPTPWSITRSHASRKEAERHAEEFRRERNRSERHEDGK